MNKIRIIARLDIKDDYVVKGCQLEGVRRVGSPNEFATCYYKDGVDEILYIDNVASLYDRNSIDEVLFETTKNIFIPVTVGGGIRSVEDARFLLSRGADKVAINTAAIKDEMIISEISSAFGSQCMVLSIQAKKNDNGWEAYYDNGREHSGKSVVEWVKRGQELGAGEILLTSVDCDGLMQGMDQNLIRAVCEAVTIPVIVCGGVRTAEDIIEAEGNGASAVAIGSILHYKKTTIRELKSEILSKGGKVRIYDSDN